MMRLALLSLLFLPVAIAQEVPLHNPESIPPTTPCEGVTGALPDAITECQKRETARLFIILGKPEAALRILCTTNAARNAFAVANLDCMKETKAEKPEKAN